MRLAIAAFIIIIIITAAVPAQERTPGTAPNQSAAIESALAKVAPSLVRIHVVSVDHQDGRELKREASGSGTIISADGHVITNHHVAGRTRAIWCTLASREEVPAELIGTDPLSDIAPIDDLRSTERYRSHVARELLREFLLSVVRSGSV